MHAQFEFLHPFLDGNGRIGRILIPLFLYNKNILSSPTFYLSEYLEEHRDEYVAHLRALGGSREAWTQWCRFFLEALTEQAERNALKVEAILNLYERLKTDLMESSHSAFAVPVLDAMFTQPIFQAGFLLLKKGMPQRAALMRILGRMVERNLLQIVVPGSGRRSTVYSLHELVILCDSSKPKRRSKAVRSGITVVRSAQ